MDDLDMMIGKNLARLRGDLSQADLAKEMKERGYKWSQATVWSIEKGDRPLRLAEAADLATIFNKEVSTLIQKEDEAVLIDGIVRQMKRVGASMEAIAESVRSYEREKKNLRQSLWVANMALKQGRVREEFKLDLDTQQERAEMIFSMPAIKLARLAAEESDGEHTEEG